MKHTRQRQAILDLMREMAERHYHPTAQEVFEELQARGHRVWLGTIYRNLETFAEMGLIGKVEVPGHPARFDGTPEPHPHIRCIRCGKVDDLPLDWKVQLNVSDLKVPGYKVEGVRIEVLGICDDCLKKELEEVN